MNHSKLSSMPTKSHSHKWGRQLHLKESPNSEEFAQRFTGKERDRVSGLDYFGARYYDSDVGYWLSPDAAREFPNLYAYMGNFRNPLNAVDLDGKSTYRMYSSTIGSGPEPFKSPVNHEFLAVIDDKTGVVRGTLSFTGVMGDVFADKSLGILEKMGAFFSDKSGIWRFNRTETGLNDMEDAGKSFALGWGQKVSSDPKFDENMLSTMKALDGQNQNYFPIGHNCSNACNAVIDVVLDRTESEVKK